MSGAGDHDPRLDLVLEALLALARLDFTYRIPQGDAGDTLDAIAVGINMLAEELEATAASKRELETAYGALQRTQAQLIHAGKLAAIGQLAGGVAHEINNPATYVAMSQAVLVRRVAEARALFGRLSPGGESDEQARVLSAMDVSLADASEGMERIRSVVRDLRTFSRIDDEQMEAVDLEEVVVAACSLARLQIRYRAQLVTDFEALPPVRGNRGRLGQVVMNLLVNAAQAIPEEAATEQRILVSTRRQPASALLVVEDSGSGVPPALRERIFEPFFTTKPADVGTGLGLSLVLEIVRRHGGNIRVTDGQQGGARFEVELPYAEVRVEAAPSIRDAEGGSASRARILAIDDDRTLLRAFHALLEPEHDVVSAGSGDEALAILARDQAFDLVLCDLLMPKVDGAAVYSALQASAPQLVERVVFCSGGAITRRSRELLASVHNPVLEKPITYQALYAVIAGRAPTSARVRGLG